MLRFTSVEFGLGQTEIGLDLAGLVDLLVTTKEQSLLHNVFVPPEFLWHGTEFEISVVADSLYRGTD